MQKRYVLLITVICVSSLLAALYDTNYPALATQINQMKTSTITLGTSITTSLSQLKQLINGAFRVISTTGTNLRCELWNFTFVANQGQYVSGNFTSDIPVDFYVVQDTSYQNWLKQGSCGSATDAIASQLLTTSYLLNPTAVPNSGRWDIVIVNSSNTRDADVTLTAYLSSGSSAITTPMLTTFTTTGAGTFTSTPLTGVPGFPVESILVGLFIGLVALMVLRNRKRV